MTRILWVDTETGGLSPDTHALLSIGLVDWQDGVVLRTDEILVDPEGLACTPKAMEVNGIDLDLHCAYSVSRSEAGQRFREFCRPMARPVVGGHNVEFDLGFIRRLFAQGSLAYTISHRCLDTMQVLAFMGHAGLIPDGIAKLDQAIAHFGIRVEAGKRHTALADAIAAAQVYTAALETMKRSVLR